MRILIAEDDPETARLLKALLVKWGYEVTTVRDGAQAWEALQAEGAPPLVILDLMMPYMWGMGWGESFGKPPTGKSCYIILLTTKPRKKDVVAGLAAGA